MRASHLICVLFPFAASAIPMILKNDCMSISESKTFLVDHCTDGPLHLVKKNEDPIDTSIFPPPPDNNTLKYKKENSSDFHGLQPLSPKVLGVENNTEIVGAASASVIGLGALALLPTKKAMSTVAAELGKITGNALAEGRAIIEGGSLVMGTVGIPSSLSIIGSLGIASVGSQVSSDIENALAHSELVHAVEQQIDSDIKILGHTIDAFVSFAKKTGEIIVDELNRDRILFKKLFYSSTTENPDLGVLSAANGAVAPTDSSKVHLTSDNSFTKQMSVSTSNKTENEPFTSRDIEGELNE